jgi:hypothetical protein
MGRWDDTLLNVPWWLAGIALSLAVFGALRAFGLPSLGALAGTWLVASLPLLDAHVALAGYADLFLTGFVTLAVLGLLRWRDSRSPDDAIVAGLSVAACLLVKSTGPIWVVAMIPAIVAALAPARGPRIAAIILAAMAALVLLLARTRLTVAGVPLHLDYAPSWTSFGASLFLFDNWHLLWYGGIAALALGWRDALAQPIAPLTLMLAGGLMYVLAVAAFPGATSRLGDATTVNRTALVIAPLVCVWIVLTMRAWARRWADARASEGAAAES